MSGLFEWLLPWQWGLLLVAAGIVALYFLKLRRIPILVPSTYLWWRTVEDVHVNSLFQRLRRNLLLLLQLLVIGLLFLAFFPLSCTVQRRSGTRYIFLIDHSASMSATDVAPNRLQQAKQKALEIADSMTDRDVGMVVAFANSARVLVPFTQNRHRIRQGIQSIEPTQSSTSLSEALEVASGLANPGSASDIFDPTMLAAEVYIFSDGALPHVEQFSLGNLNPHFVPIGQSSRNVGIVAMSTRPNEERPGQFQVFARVESFFAHDSGCPHREKPSEIGQNRPAESTCTCEPLVTLAELDLDGQLIDAQEIELRPKASAGVVFDLAELRSGVLELRLGAEDALAVDNRAWTAVNPPRRARVLVVGPDDNPFLDYGLQTPKAQELADIERHPVTFLGEPAYLQAAQAGRYDLVIYDRCAPETWPRANTWFIGRWPSTENLPSSEEVQWPVILDVNRSHPLMRYVGMETVEIAKMRKARAPSSAQVLVQTDQGPALLLLPREGFQDLIMAFELVSEGQVARQGWHAHPSFPVFALNVLRELASAGELLEEQSVPPGRPIVLRSPTPEPLPRVRVVAPAGQAHTLQRSPQNTYVFHQTDQTGVYAVQWPSSRNDPATEGTRRHSFTVNLFNSVESDITPRADIQIAHETVAATTTVEPARRHLWKYFLLAALAVLLLEWYAYHRRVYY